MVSNRKYNDLDISIEYKKDQIRSGKNRDGEEWSYKMHCDYGYILGTHSPDGEHLDCYICPKPDTEAKVYVVHQMTPDGSSFDEDKVMLGFKTEKAAVDMYNKHMNFSPHLFGGVCEFEQDHFKLMAYQASKSTSILAHEDVVAEFRKSKLIKNSIRSPVELAKKVSEGKYFIRSKSNKHSLDNRPYTTLNEAKAALNRLPLSEMFEVGRAVSEKSERMLFEGFLKGDLKGILLPRVSLDEYVPNSDTNIVLSVFIKNEPEAIDPLMVFFEMLDGVEEVDTSDSNTLKQTSIIYIEIMLDDDTADKIDEIVDDLVVLSDYEKKEFVMMLPNTDSTPTYSKDFVSDYCNLAYDKRNKAKNTENTENVENEES